MGPWRRNLPGRPSNGERELAHGVVQQKAYSLLLVSYISASHHEDPEIEDDVSSSNSSIEMGTSLESKRKQMMEMRIGN